MTLLAEALAARKDAAQEIATLRERLVAAVVRYEDQKEAVDRPAMVLDKLKNSLDQFQSLTIRINRTNNGTRVAFDGLEMTLMEAIALRERLTLEAKVRRGAVDAVQAAVGTPDRDRRAMFGMGARRTKDDVREIPTVDLAAERKAADGLSETVRRLDLAIQQRNWTTDLLD